MSRPGRLLAAVLLAFTAPILWLPMRVAVRKEIDGVYRVDAAVNIAGWRDARQCLAGSMSYAPRRGELADSKFVEELPEQVATGYIAHHLGHTVVDVRRVDINLQSSTATVWVDSLRDDGSAVSQSLSLSGEAATTTSGIFAAGYPPCWTHIGSWRVVSVN